MSVVLYSQKKFLKIYKTLEPEGRGLAWLFHYPDGWDGARGIDCYLRSFINDLYRANTLTWNRQYPDEVQEIKTINFSQTVLPYGNSCQLYKSLLGLRYNLCDNEGKESDLNNCLERLNRVIDHIALEIIQEIPAYQDANTW